MPHIMTKRGSILMLAVISEVALVLIAYSVAWFYALEVSWDTSFEAVVIGAAAAAPLLLGNHLLWSLCLRAANTRLARFILCQTAPVILVPPKPRA
jgi:hypothetical protein